MTYAIIPFIQDRSSTPSVNATNAQFSEKGLFNRRDGLLIAVDALAVSTLFFIGLMALLYLSQHQLPTPLINLVRHINYAAASTLVSAAAVLILVDLVKIVVVINRRFQEFRERLQQQENHLTSEMQRQQILCHNLQEQIRQKDLELKNITNQAHSPTNDHVQKESQEKIKNLQEENSKLRVELPKFYKKLNELEESIKQQAGNHIKTLETKDNEIQRLTELLREKKEETPSPPSTEKTQIRNESNNTILSIPDSFKTKERYSNLPTILKDRGLVQLTHPGHGQGDLLIQEFLEDKKEVETLNPPSTEKTQIRNESNNAIISIPVSFKTKDYYSNLPTILKERGIQLTYPSFGQEDLLNSKLIFHNLCITNGKLHWEEKQRWMSEHRAQNIKKIFLIGMKLNFILNKNGLNETHRNFFKAWSLFEGRVSNKNSNLSDQAFEQCIQNAAGIFWLILDKNAQVVTKVEEIPTSTLYDRAEWFKGQEQELNRLTATLKNL